MTALYNLGLFFLFSYLVINAAIPVDRGVERPEVQLVAGLAVASMFVYCAFYALRNTRITRVWPFSRYWMAFITLIVSYSFLSFVELPTNLALQNPRNAFVGGYVMLTAFFIYYGVIHKRISDGKLLLLLMCLLAAGLLDMYEAIVNPRNRSGIDVINTSSGYVFAMLLPLLMYRFRDQAIWVFVITLALTAITGKRGALVIFAVLFIYSVWNLRSIASVVKINIKTILAAVAVCGVALLFFDVAYESLQYRLTTIVNERGTIGSGRDVIWSTLIGHWLRSTPSIQILGNGYYSTISIYGLAAHNDFIQFLLDYGLIGLSLYLTFLISFYRDIRSLCRGDAFIHYLLTVCLIILIGRGVFAGTLRTDQLYLSVSIGYLLGVSTINRLKRERKN